MKPWLRLTLITMTVGGGFTGVVLTLESLLNSPTLSPFNLLIMVFFLALYAGVTASGLVFVNNPQLTGPIIAALAVQIPWISSPLLVYKFAAGLHLVLSAGSPTEPGTFGFKFGWEILLGSSFRFALLQQNPWSVGINLFPLVILILLSGAVRKPVVISPPTIPSPADANSTSGIL